MYKILLLRRANTVDPLWSTYKVPEMIDEVKVMVDFQTDDMEVLETKIEELLETIPKNQIKPIQDMEFLIEVIVGAL